MILNRKKPYAQSATQHWKRELVKIAHERFRLQQKYWHVSTLTQRDSRFKKTWNSVPQMISKSSEIYISFDWQSTKILCNWINSIFESSKSLSFRRLQLLIPCVGTIKWVRSASTHENKNRIVCKQFSFITYSRGKKESAAVIFRKVGSKAKVKRPLTGW